MNTLGKSPPIRLLRAILYVCSTLLFSQLHAQPIPFLFNQLTVEDGLSSQVYNYYVQKDPYRYIWISSMNGLNRYDGRTIKQFRAQPESPDSLLDNATSTPYFADHDSSLWVSSEHAFYNYQPKFGCFQTYQIPDLPHGPQNMYQIKYMDPAQRTVWVKVDTQLYVYPLYDQQEVQQVYKSSRLYTTSVLEKHKTNADRYLLFNFSHAGLEIQPFLHAHPMKPQVQEAAAYFNGQEVKSILYLDDRQIWVGLMDGLGRVDLYHDQEHLLAPKYQGKPVEDIVSLQQLDENHLLVATRNSGLYMYNISANAYTGQVYRQLHDRVEPFLYEIQTIYLDDDRTLWITSPGQGVFFTHLDKIKFDNYFLAEYPDTVRTAGIKDITEDRSGRIWAISQHKVHVWDESGKPLADLYHTINDDAAFQGDHLFCIEVDNEDRIWLGSNGGLYLYRPARQRFTPVQFTEKKTGPGGIAAVNQLGDGSLIATASFIGAYELYLSRATGKWKARRCILEDHTFTWVHEFSDHRLLVCRYKHSLQIMSGLHYPMQRDTLIDFQPLVGGIVEDTLRNRLWLPADDGLYYLERRGSDFELVRDSVIGSYIIHGVLIDEWQQLWLSTSNGLIRYCPTKGEHRRYYLSDGIQGKEFRYASFYRTRSGHLLFGGTNGITIVRKDSVLDIASSAFPVIAEILIDGLPQEEIRDTYSGVTEPAFLRHLRLPYRHNGLYVSFAPREYSFPDNINYRFVLIKNQDTLAQGTELQARFPNLREGKYQLSVYATNSDGVWSPRPHTLHFTISPPFWRSVLGYTIQILTLVLLGGLIGLLYNRRLRRLQQERIKQLELVNAVQRLQMNPHFLSNSITAIASHVIKKDVATAYHYLSRFGKLMRQMLYLAAKPSITLDKEVDLMHLYLEVEQLRFGDKLTFDISVDPALDPEEVQIPTMLVQPFIENAIKHGLGGRRGEGHVQVDFKKDGEQLCCIVRDNGVGRAATAEQKKEGHISKALQITKRRLQSLQEQTKQPTSLEFEDLYNEQGEAAGTKVILKIPLQ